jgi:hypothetical protein
MNVQWRGWAKPIPKQKTFLATPEDQKFLEYLGKGSGLTLTQIIRRCIRIVTPTQLRMWRDPDITDGQEA